MTSWCISIDWDRNGTYQEIADNLTDLVIGANWFLGSDELYQEVADNSILSLILKNEDRLFSPENTASPLYGKVKPFKPVRIQSNDGTVVRTHWVGWIEAIRPAVNRYGQRTVEIPCYRADAIVQGR